MLKGLTGSGDIILDPSPGGGGPSLLCHRASQSPHCRRGQRSNPRNHARLSLQSS